MRIISKFNDYYDAVQREGQDQTLIYLRNKETIKKEIEFPQTDLLNKVGFWYMGTHGKLHVEIKAIGFCGKVYPIVGLKKNAWADPTYCYGLADVDAFVEANFKEKDVKGFRHKGKKYGDCINGWVQGQQRHVFEDFFKAWADKKNNYQDLFYNHPIFVVKIANPSIITYNECLKGFEFFRVFDTYSAYQEITMYMGNLAQPNKPIPEVPDKVMVEAKGFHKKWSFRKPPEKKK